jgi:hypothetical protein
MYILTKIPDKNLLPLAFLNPETGHQDLIEPITSTIQGLQKYIGANRPEIIEEWNEFKKLFPVDNESVESYIEKFFLTFILHC